MGLVNLHSDEKVASVAISENNVLQSGDVAPGIEWFQMSGPEVVLSG